MAARRCSKCNIDYPRLTTYQTCEVCGERTWYIESHSPDEDFQTRVTALMKKAPSKEGLAVLYSHPPDAEATILTRGDEQFILHQDLTDAGYRHLESFSIVFVNDVFYELHGHSFATYRIVGEHYANGVWWVREVATELEGDTFPQEWGGG